MIYAVKHADRASAQIPTRGSRKAVDGCRSSHWNVALDRRWAVMLAGAIGPHVWAAVLVAAAVVSMASANACTARSSSDGRGDRARSARGRYLPR